MYVEGAFYNDVRAAGWLDYSQPIRAFCQAHSILPPPRPLAAPLPEHRDSDATPSFSAAMPPPRFWDGPGAPSTLHETCISAALPEPCQDVSPQVTLAASCVCPVLRTLMCD